MKTPRMFRWGAMVVASTIFASGCATVVKEPSVSTTTTTREESASPVVAAPKKGKGHSWAAERSPASEAFPVGEERPHARPDEGMISVTKLYYATDRVWTGSSDQPKWFGSDWNQQSGHLTYGTCDVSIPVRAHTLGEVEKPSIWRLEFSEDPQKHVVVYSPERLTQSAFFSALDADVRQRSQKEIMIFIHGFNNTFDDAASRLGVLDYDIGFGGIPVLYSWSSVGGGFRGVAKYLHDEETIQRTYRPLTDFLADVAQTGKDAGVKRISIVAHSMGNRALIAAMKTLAERTGGKILFDEVVMAAPDVPAQGFGTDEWPEMQRKTGGPARRVTLYASSDDRALASSRHIHDYRRIGEAGDGLLLLPGLDTIDASGCDFSLLGLNHNYFGGPRILPDLSALVQKGLTPLERKLRQVKRGDLPYWLVPQLADR